MTLKALIAADVSNVFLNTDEFAESVTRWPQGYEGSAVTVTAVWEPDDVSHQFSGDGESYTQEGSLHVVSSMTIHREDVWIIGDERYATVDTGKVEGGLRSLRLRSVNKILTKRHNSGEMY